MLLVSISHSSNTDKTAAGDKDPWIKLSLSCFVRNRSISEVHSYRTGDSRLAESSSCERLRGVTDVDRVEGEEGFEVMVAGGKRGAGKMLAVLTRALTFWIRDGVSGVTVSSIDGDS